MNPDLEKVLSDKDEVEELASEIGMCVYCGRVVTSLTSTLHMQRVANCRLYNGLKNGRVLVSLGDQGDDVGARTTTILLL